MIDVSDGLAADCTHIAEASGLQIALETIPVAEGATEADGLFGGDDYVLVACGGRGDGWTRIGWCVEGEGVTLRGERLDPKGWEHAL